MPAPLDKLAFFFDLVGTVNVGEVFFALRAFENPSGHRKFLMLEETAGEAGSAMIQARPRSRSSEDELAKLKC